MSWADVKCFFGCHSLQPCLLVVHSEKTGEIVGEVHCEECTHCGVILGDFNLAKKTLEEKKKERSSAGDS